MPTPAAITPTLRGFLKAASEISLLSPAARYGIKFALGGTLAFYLALLMRLDTPIWSVITVFMLMIARYFGAMAEKSLFRVLGTLVGGLIGYLLTGSLQQEPTIYLLLIAAVVAFSTTMFGQTRAPYAFLLLGLTTSVVAANGLSNPEQSWQVALARIEEVTLGVVVALLVSSIVWPVFARVEFRKAVSDELLRLRDEFLERAAIFLSATPIPTRSTPSSARLAGIRNILHAGCRESAFFRSRLPTYSEMIRRLSRIAAAVESLEEPRVMTKEAEFLRKALEDMRDSVANALMATAGSDPSNAKMAIDACSAARTRLGEALPIRDPHAMSTGQALDMGAWIAAVEEIAECSAQLHRLRSSLPEKPGERSPEKLPPSDPPLDPFWITNGIRAGIAVALALFVQDWLNPPGGSMVTLATWVFCALSRLYPGGEGDRGAFKYAALTALWGLLYIPAMLILAPVMSDYVALNILLAAAMFLFGYLSYGIPGMSFGMQLGMLTIVCTLGLNSQRPVEFQQILDVYFGIVIGLLISAVVQRLLWPVLPQRQLRDRLLEWLEHIRAVSSEATPDRWRLLRMGLLPAETSAWAEVIEKGARREARRERLMHVIDLLSRVGNLLALRREKDPPSLPKAIHEEITAKETALIAAIATATGMPEALLHRQPVPADPGAALELALRGWEAETESLRTMMIDENVPLEQRIRAYAGLELAGGAAREMLRLVRLFPELGPGDYAVDSRL